MEREELYLYFLEKSGFEEAKHNAYETQKALDKIYQSCLNEKSQISKLLNLYKVFEAIDSYEYRYIDEEELRKDFEIYKETVRKILKEIPTDYDLKSQIVFDGLDFETFDEKSFNMFCCNKKHQLFINEVSKTINECDLSYEESHELFSRLLSKYELDNIDLDVNDVIRKLTSFLDEIENLINEKYGTYYNFHYSECLLGRMYLRIIDKIMFIYMNSKDKDTINKEYEILLKAYQKDGLQDYLRVNNFLGFICYYFDDKTNYKNICNLLHLRGKLGVIEYFLKNLDKIFSTFNNNKYIYEIIKRNFLFFPILINGDNTDQENTKGRNFYKGSMEEAKKLVYYYTEFLYKKFDTEESHIIKDFMHNLEDYFNYYFDDDSLSYNSFRVLEEIYMENEDKKAYSIEEFKNRLVHELKIKEEDFLKIFKSFCDIKIIKKCNQVNYFFNNEMELLVRIDIDNNSTNDDYMNELEIDEGDIDKFKA